MSAKSNLTAWERWELASFDEPEPAAANEPAVTESAASPAPSFSAEEITALREAARAEGFAAGHKEGHEAGYAEGQRAGEKHARKQGEEAAGHLAQAMERFEAQLGELNHAVAEEIVALGVEIAQRVLRQAIAAKPESIVAVVREALVHLPMQHAAIHLHPDDASLTRSYAGEQLTHAGHRIHEDPRLSRGDVIIECGGSHLDASLATRWRRVLETIGRSEPWLGTEDQAP